MVVVAPEDGIGQDDEGAPPPLDWHGDPRRMLDALERHLAFLGTASDAMWVRRPHDPEAGPAFVERFSRTSAPQVFRAAMSRCCAAHPAEFERYVTFVRRTCLRVMGLSPESWDDEAWSEDQAAAATLLLMYHYGA